MREARSSDAARWHPPSDHRGVTVAAWTTTLLAGAVPAIAWQEVTGAVPVWLPLAQAAVALALLAASLLWPALAPLRRYAVVLAALLLLLFGSRELDLTWPALQAAFGSSAFDARMQAEQVGKLVVAALMVAVLFALGFGRREAFLTVGRIAAPIRPVRVLGFPHADSWWRFGTIWGLGIAAALALAQYLIVRPSPADLNALVPLLPSVLLYAALNAFSEEMTYRAPMLAALEPATGSAHALWQAAVFFGVAHYFGVPGGLSGAALSIFMGWILSKAMLETRGLFWPWAMHFASDVVIFSALAVVLVR